MNNDDADREHVRERLHAEGFVVPSVYALEKDPAVLKRAAPVLLDLMAEVSSMRVKIDLVHVMSSVRLSPKFLVEELRRLAPALEQELKLSQSSERSASALLAKAGRTDGHSTGASSLAWTLADALSGQADASVYADIVNLIRDKRFGRARKMLVYAFAKIKARRQEALQILVESLEDKEITSCVIDVLGRMKAVEALPAIRPYLDSSNRLVRSEAQKAIKKIEKASSGKKDAPHSAPQAPPPMPEGLAEASMNFELEDVTPFLGQVARLVDGFGPAEIERIESTLLEMEPDDETGFDFTVRHGGRTTPLQVRIFMDDVGAPDVGFFTSPQLAEAVGQLMGEPKQQSPCE